MNDKNMKWNIEKIVFLHQPEYFLGSFDNPKMQSRHEKELEKSLSELKTALANESDPLNALNILNQRDHIQFLLNNFEEFRTHDRLEETVIALYSKNNDPFSSGGDSALWQKLFNDCDRSKLNKCGRPFPSTVTTVYRGSVSGFKKSLAWTPDKMVVEKFATRWKDPSLGGGELYEVDITPDNVLVYRQIKHQKIIILTPEFINTAEIRSYQT